MENNTVTRWVHFKRIGHMDYGVCHLSPENNSLAGFLKLFHASNTELLTDAWLLSSLGTRVRVWPLPDCMAHPRPLAENAVPDDAVQCSNCYEVIDDIDDAREVDGETYCESCHDELFGMCERCEESVLIDDLTEVRTGEGSRRRATTEQWCESCHDRHATKCDDCGDYVTESSRIQGSNVCNSCYENGDYSYCESCNETYHSDQMVYRRDASYCRECAPSESEYIHDADYTPRLQFHGDSDRIHYGVELEVTADSDDAENVVDAMGDDHVYLKEDGSVSDGFEIVTHPHTLEAHRELWGELFDTGIDLDASRHGMHVHIERAHLTKLQVGKIDVFVNSPANTDFIVAVAGRNSSRWAPLNSGRKITDGDSGRKYVAVNLQHDKTVELRIFRGTTDRARLFANLEFCDALVGFTKHASIRALEYRSFCNYVRRYRKVYPHLDAFLVDAGYLPAMRARKVAA